MDCCLYRTILFFILHIIKYFYLFFRTILHCSVIEPVDLLLWFDFFLYLLNEFYLFPTTWLPLPWVSATASLCFLFPEEKNLYLTMWQGIIFEICLNSAFSVWKTITLAIITWVAFGEKLFLNRIPSAEVSTCIKEDLTDVTLCTIN